MTYVVKNLDKKEFACENCLRSFARKKGLYEHQRSSCKGPLKPLGQFVPDASPLDQAESMQ
jgi:hypothetical protein